MDLQRLTESLQQQIMQQDGVTIEKQMNYANDKQIKFVALIGENEIKENKVSLKNMDSGEQTFVEISEIENIIKG